MTSPYESGRLIVDLISESNTNQSRLADATNVTPAYVNHVVTGRRVASAEWLDLVSGALKLQEGQRKALHKAAAQDVLRTKLRYDVDLD